MQGNRAEKEELLLPAETAGRQPRVWNQRSSVLPFPLPSSGSRITPFKSPTSLLVILGAAFLGAQLCSGWSWALLGTQNLAL